MKNKEKKALLILIVALIFLDQILKIIFLATNAKLGNVEGWSLGILSREKSESNVQYILISIIAIITLIRYATRNNTYIKMNSRVVISFAIAGCISSIIDRIWNGAVINYINIPKFISINLGYIYIAVTWIGMAIILTNYTGKAIAQKRIKTQIEKEVENEKRNNSK